MLAPKESRNLKKTTKRLGWFLVCVFVLCLVESYLLVLAGISPVVNGIIVIITAALLYLVFLVICAKIDKKREREGAESPSKDPFSR